MAVILPSTINGVPYSAEVMRRNDGAGFAQSAPGVVRTGVLGPAPAVSLSGSTVQVGAFNGVIGSAKGAYFTGLDSVTPAEGAVPPADATNGRLDRIVLEVLDPDNGSAGTTRTGRLRLIPGTAAAIPVLPALPPLALHVGQVQMPKSGSGNPVVTVDPPFTAASGAPVPVRSVAERDSLDPAVVREAKRLDGRGTDFVVGGSWVSAVEGLAGSAGWNLVGSVERSPAGGSAIRNLLTLKLVRSGGTFSVGNTSGFVGATGAVIPASARPTSPVDVPVSYVSSASTWGGSAVLRIETSGTISILPVAPTTTLSITQNGYFNFNASWIA